MLPWMMPMFAWKLWLSMFDPKNVSGTHDPLSGNVEQKFLDGLSFFPGMSMITVNINLPDNKKAKAA